MTVHSMASSAFRRLILALIACALLLASRANAQSEPSVPVVAAVFSPSEVEPNPCFEFACYNGSVLDDDTLAATGAVFPGVYVFVRSPAGTYSFQTVLVNPEVADPRDDRSFGSVVALSGDTLLVSGAAGESSKVYVFRRRGTTWTLRQTLPVNVTSIALDHDTALIGTGSDVRVFEERRGQFRLQAILKSEPGSDGSFGSTLDLDGNVALIGAPGVSGVGAAYAFQRLGSFWFLLQKFMPSVGILDTGFAAAVAVDHNRIFIGAPNTPSVVIDRPGIVQVYERRGLRWHATDTLQNPIPDDGYFRQFGNALDARGSRLLVSGKTFYPFAPTLPMNYLFDVRRMPQVIALLGAGDARSVGLAGRSALVDVTGLRFGTFPEIFDLPR